MVFAFFSAFSIMGAMASTLAWASAGTASMRICSSPAFNARTERERTSELSLTSGNACGVPTIAWETDFASRCDCISACPVADNCCDTFSVCDSAKKVTMAKTTNESASKAANIRWCAATVRIPNTGIYKSSPVGAALSVPSTASRCMVSTPAGEAGIGS